MPVCLRPELVPVFVAVDGEGRRQAGGIDDRAVGRAADAGQLAGVEARVVELERIGVQHHDATRAVGARAAPEHWVGARRRVGRHDRIDDRRDIDPLDARVDHVGQARAAARDGGVGRHVDPAAALIVRLPDDDEIAQAVVADDEAVAGVGRIAQHVEAHRLVGHAVGRDQVGVGIAVAHADEVVARAALMRNCSTVGWMPAVPGSPAAVCVIWMPGAVVTLLVMIEAVMR